MKLEKWALVAEVVGGSAIVVSLIFVGVEVQRSRIAQIQTGTQAVVSEYNTAVRALAEEPELACMYVVGLQDYYALRGGQRVRFSAYMIGVFNAIQQMHLLFRQGAIDADTWAGFDGAVSEVSSTPGWRDWFSTRKSWFGEDFRNYLHGKIEREDVVKAVSYDDPQCSELLDL